MKKSVSILFCLAAALGFAAAAFAEDVEGSIESVRASKNEVVVKDRWTGGEKTITVHPKVVANLKPGTIVKASLKPGSTAADTISVVVG